MRHFNVDRLSLINFKIVWTLFTLNTWNKEQLIDYKITRFSHYNKIYINIYTMNKTNFYLYSCTFKIKYIVFL